MYVFCLHQDLLASIFVPVHLTSTAVMDKLLMSKERFSPTKETVC